MQNQAKQNESCLFDRAALRKLLERADSGDESAVPEIRGLLDGMPELVQPFGGDLAQNAERALVRAISGKRICEREAIHKKMSQLCLELGGSNPSPLERLLVERIVLCWLHAYHADCKCAGAKGITLEHGDYLQRQQDGAQRRFLAAIKCLATVRRLLSPIKLDVTLAAKLQAGGVAGTGPGRSHEITVPPTRAPVLCNGDATATSRQSKGPFTVCGPNV